MRKLLIAMTLFVAACTASKKAQQEPVASDAERILKTLSSDDMRGRAAFTAGAEKAASFIESEFAKYKLNPGNGSQGYRQTFTVTRVSPGTAEITIDGKNIDPANIVVLTDRARLNWNSNAVVIKINPGDNIFQRYQEIARSGKESLVLVHESFAKDFMSLRSYLAHGRIIDSADDKLAAVFVLGVNEASNYLVNINTKVEELPLFNVAAILPGKSKPNEIVIFSAHYDHIGILNPVNGDSIANGADDDASGVTAVLSLAKYFRQQNNNERTLLFVTFTAEELGMVGSKHFSKSMNADSVVAMFNIEMIGKESKFGKNAAFITGFDRSNFGQILQKNLLGTEFTFHPDPYTEQNLFYRSDNATLAAMGVPAHTISTDQIDQDKFYHTVGDEYATLDIENVKATIRAIALAARGIVSGTDTPSRVTKK